MGDIRDRRIPGNNPGTEQWKINTEDILGGKILPRRKGTRDEQ